MPYNLIERLSTLPHGQSIDDNDKTQIEVLTDFIDFCVGAPQHINTRELLQKLHHFFIQAPETTVHLYLPIESIKMEAKSIHYSIPTDPHFSSLDLALRYCLHNPIIKNAIALYVNDAILERYPVSVAADAASAAAPATPVAAPPTIPSPVAASPVPPVVPIRQELPISTPLTTPVTAVRKDRDDFFKFYGSAQSQDRIVIAGNSVFKPELELYLIIHGLENRLVFDRPSMHIVSDLRWIRDPVVNRSTGPGFVNLPWIDVTEHLFFDPDYTPFQDARDLYPKYDEYRRYHPRVEPANLTPGAVEFIQRIPGNVRGHLKSSYTLPIAGGNIIKARNEDNHLKYIVGIHAVFSVIKFAYNIDPNILTRIREKAQSKSQWAALTPQQQEFYVRFKLAKSIIRLFLINDALDPHKQVIFVNQVCYHLDLDVLYCFPGALCVNSYEEFTKNDAIAAKYLNGRDLTFYREYFRELQLRHQTQINNLILQLRKARFHVIPAAASTMYLSGIAETTRPLTSNPDNYNDRIWQPIHGFCFINGIGILQKEKTLDILIGATAFPRNTMQFDFWQIFTNNITQTIPHGVKAFLKGRNYHVRFIKIPAMPTVRDRLRTSHPSEEFIWSTEGGLRCSTMKLPGE